MNLKELRAKHNLTQSALAKSIGVTSNAISAIEGGRLKLSDKLAAKIKELYGEEATVLVEAEKAVEEVAASVEKKAARKARATKKKVEAEAEKVADTAAEVVLETEKKVEKKARKVKAKAQADKSAAAVLAEAVVAPVVETVDAVIAPVEAAVVETVAAPVEAAVVEKKGKKKAPAKTTTKKKAPVAKKKAPATPLVILQSPFGGEITAEEILSKVGEADKIYVRIDQNKAYWVKGEETGDADLW